MVKLLVKESNWTLPTNQLTISILWQVTATTTCVYTETTGLTGSFIEGDRLVRTPQHTANLSFFYTVPTGMFKNVSCWRDWKLHWRPSWRMEQSSKSSISKQRLG